MITDWRMEDGAIFIDETRWKFGRGRTGLGDLHVALLGNDGSAGGDVGVGGGDNWFQG